MVINKVDFKYYIQLAGDTNLKAGIDQEAIKLITIT